MKTSEYYNTFKVEANKHKGREIKFAYPNSEYISIIEAIKQILSEGNTDFAGNVQKTETSTEVRLFLK